MHAIHHTDAFIVKIVPSGEANARVWLFTRDFGLVIAAVQGVRKSGSKLAMQLSEYSLAEVDLVRGREVWRLISITQTSNPFLEKAMGGEAMRQRTRSLGRGFVRTLAAVERFCQGEEAHVALFDHLVACLEVLRGAWEPTESNESNFDVRSFDTLALWKVLVHLGYGAVPDDYQPLFSEPLSDAIRHLTSSQRSFLIKDVNTIIKETQL